MAVKKRVSDSDAIEEVVVNAQTTEKAKEMKTKQEKIQIEAEAEVDERKEKFSATVDRDKGAILIGAGLLVMGLLLLISSLFDFSIGNYFWPFIFIIPGALVFFAAISSQRSNGEGLAIVGGLFTMLGLVFLMQSITGLWATWAYIWALIAPTSIGLSQMFYGNIKNDDTIAHTGWNLTKIGLSILAVGFVFFELIIGLNGFGLARLGLPVFPMILIFVGGFLLVRSLIRAR